MKLIKFWILLFFLLLQKSFASYIDCPTIGYYLNKGLLSDYKYLALKASYFYDNTYYSRFQEKFINVSPNKANVKLTTNACFLTLNIYKYLDVYGILGNSKFTLDDMIYAKNHLCWGAGGRLFLFQIKKFAAGIDGRYFRSDQKPTYLVDDKQLYPLATEQTYKYEEIQFALGFSYKVNIFLPYIGPYYLYSEVETIPKNGLIRVSSTDDLYDFQISTIENRKKFGLFLGVNILAHDKISLSFESRFFSQMAFSSALSVRF